MTIKIRNLNKSFGDKIVFENLSVDFRENDISCILGKSGCGKTTLVNIIAGLIEFQSGEITGVEEDTISYIFQEHRLVPWLTVEENLNLVLKRFFNSEEISNRIDKYLSLVNMSEYKKYYPSKLSGGMKQRINIARAFAVPSKLVVMDEAFNSLDIKNRDIIISNIKEILKTDERTLIFITHDIDEAIAFNGAVFVIRNGEIKGPFLGNLQKHKYSILELI